MGDECPLLAVRKHNPRPKLQQDWWAELERQFLVHVNVITWPIDNNHCDHRHDCDLFLLNHSFVVTKEKRSCWPGNWEILTSRRPTTSNESMSIWVHGINMPNAHCCDDMGHHALGQINNRVAYLNNSVRQKHRWLKREFEITFYSYPSFIDVFRFEEG